ncbi:MFS transporter [Vibrio sp. SCSIO 43137]|uniref:MFS transporter n=1 Tax=Vibrio sp. SCSIO 43137 TaxID=3021011 RepID=UPI002307782D|nr:MFS transporter [Vibrio sp. SCSIO 43137]WCE31592.1 MFS transporter [Vibrio sp. SCSIO 43137]
MQTSLWNNKDYIRLLGAQVLSLLGTGISSVALALLAWELAKEQASLVLSIAFALKMVAYIVLAPLFGAFATRLNRKRVLVALDIFRALLFVCMPFVSQLWQVYLLMFLVNACSAGFTPIYQSTLPDMLPQREHYTKALSFSRMAYDLEQVLSPLLAALLLTLMSYNTLFYLDALSFVVSALLILSCRSALIAGNGKKQQGEVQVKWLHGVQSYLGNLNLRSLWFAYLAASAASAMVIVNTVVYVHQILKGGDSQTAIAMALVGSGSLFIAIKLPGWLKKRSAEFYICYGLALICLAMFAGSTTPNWPGFVLICLTLGAGMSLIQTPAGLIISESKTGAQINELFAAHFSLTHFWWFFTYLGAGLSASYFGLSGAYLVMGMVSVIAVLLLLFTNRLVRQS